MNTPKGVFLIYAAIRHRKRGSGYINQKSTRHWRVLHLVVAERGGFEPPVQLPIRQFSKLLV
jgi:hypothetical protein